MLNIYFGAFFAPDDVIMDNRLYFQFHKKPEWFTTDFAKRVISEIDKAEVLFEEALKDRFGHGISTMQLSTGTKSLLCLYNEHNRVFNGTMMGNNCIPFLMEIAREHDIEIMLEHFMDFRDEDMQYITVFGKPVDMYEYECCYSDWAEWVDTESKEFYERIARGEKVKPVMPHLPREV